MKVLFVLRAVDYIDPMGIMLLSAIAKRDGHRTYLNVLTDGNLMDSFKRIKPDVVAYSAKTGEHKFYLEANKAIKAYAGSGVFSILGGPHTTFHPDTIDREEHLDAVCVGEGDDAWSELLAGLNSGGDVHSIANILTRQNRASNLIPNLRDRRTYLDDLPYFDRELVYNNTRLGAFPMRCFMAGRGCPYPCTYCFNRRYNEMYRGKGKLYNRYSVARMCAELRELKERWPTQFIKFYDDVFVFRDDEWLAEFAGTYPREVGLPFHCLVRADLLTEPMLLNLKQAGLQSISMSIESGNDYVRAKLLERGMSREDILRGFGLCKKHHIYTFSNSILAIPVKREIEEQHRLPSPIERDFETLDLNIDCGVTFGEFPILFPYPGTKLGQYCIENGFFDGDYDQLHTTYHNASPLTCFAPREKLMQKNLSLLGLVCLMFPWMRWLTKKVLIRLPLTRLYFLMFYLAKAYLIKYRIYPMSFSMPNFINNVTYSLKLEWSKRSNEKFYRRPIHLDRPTSEVLSGPWSN